PRLKGTSVEAGDLRGGAALVSAGLAADGVTMIRCCKHILRGYEDICRDLQSLGADIQYMEE
ncbi:MAG: UDP-N-acetylglucosamine 1-carboxyvinyltransferase, partial [Clostridium sp.]